jgi:hypothetical protein
MGIERCIVIIGSIQVRWFAIRTFASTAGSQTAAKHQHDQYLFHNRINTSVLQVLCQQ